MKLSQIKKIGVIGSGIMGHGIGQTFALAGYEVMLKDISEAILEKALRRIRSNLDTFIEFGITTPVAAREAFERIKTNKNLKATAEESDFVVEALPEVMDLKKAPSKSWTNTALPIRSSQAILLA
ncbi:MAG: 3-hydroxyacyl-CoA dehydrogenase NAD-binding domain-containing protein [Thermodesulfobacteriota bacterium]|nr:3-hydroxyacyl-CoA dehydrogenase NAD-binding domain-containing protein [Thermodesulfobacteriota bacterium]